MDVAQAREAGRQSVNGQVRGGRALEHGKLHSRDRRTLQQVSKAMHADHQVVVRKTSCGCKKATPKLNRP
jgi:hypothetical protein